MPEHCIHEEDFGKMKNQIAAINKVLFDNGTKGLSTQVTELNINLKNKIEADLLKVEEDKELKNAVKDLRTTVSGLDLFKTNTELEKAMNESFEEKQERTKQAMEKTKQFKLTFYVASILSLATIIVAILSYLK